MTDQIKRKRGRPTKVKAQVETVEKGWDDFFLKGINFDFSQGKVSDIYSQHQVAFMALDLIATNLAMVDFKLYLNGKDGQEIVNGDLYNLFQRPNQLCSGLQLWEITGLLWKYRGNCFWIVNDEPITSISQGAVVPKEITVISPDNVKPKLNNEKNLIGWNINNKFYDLTQIIHFKKYNIKGGVLGFDPSKVIEDVVNMDYKSIKYNNKFYDNNATLSGVLSTDKPANEKQIQLLKKQFNERHQGINKAFELAVLGNGLKYQSIGMNHKDMMFLEQRKYHREEVLGFYGTPKSFFSITDDINYATAITQTKLFWQSTIKPILRNIEDTVNSKFLSRMKGNIFGFFDLTSVEALTDDLHLKVDTATKLVNIGFTPNEVNKRLDLGFDETPWRDQAFIPMGMQRIDIEQAEGIISTTDTENSDPITDEDGSDQNSETNSTTSSKKLDSILDRVPSQIQQTKKLEFARSSYLKMFLEWELFFESKINKHLRYVRKKVLTQISKAHFKSIYNFSDINWDDIDQHLKETIKPLFLGLTAQSVKLSTELIGIQPNEKIMAHKIFSIVSERLSHIKEINRTTKKKIEAELRKGFAEGLTTQEIADNIKGYFNTVDRKKRALMIARTEVTGASNEANILYLKEVGIKKKQWISSHDEFVRPTHRLEGKDSIADVDKPFINGLMWPASAGDPAEVINCRCVAVGVPDIELQGDNLNG